MDALGLVDLDITLDVELARRDLRRIARGHGLEVVDVLAFRPDDWRWIFRVVEAVHRFGVAAVVVEDQAHLHGLHKAVLGVADLVTRYAKVPYVGYGASYVRPSVAGGGR